MREGDCRLWVLGPARMIVGKNGISRDQGRGRRRRRQGPGGGGRWQGL